MIYMITSVCLQMPNSYTPACNSALTASAMQLGIQQDVDALQRHYEKKLEQFTNEHLGHNAVLIGVAYIGLITQDKIVVNAPIRPIADNINFSVTPKTNSINTGLSWAF